MLNQIHLKLPKNIDYTELMGYAKMKDNPLSLDLPADNERFNFYLIEMPLNILIPENYQLVRLRISLYLETEEKNSDKVIAYDLFPPDKWEEKTTALGEFKLDVSKMLSFIWEQPVAECFGLNLNIPIKWKSKSVQIRTSDRMSNPVEWYVTDQAIDNGFTGYVVIRTPKNTFVNINAVLACELRKPGILGKILKARYQSESQKYSIS